MSQEPSTAELMQMCYYHAEKATAKAEFYKVKSTASYRNQAANNCQEWADFYAAMADKLETLLESERTLPNE